MREGVIHFVALFLAVSWMFSPVYAQELSIVACLQGDTRLCGSSVGECEKGTTNCEGGMFGDCEGGVRPAEEDCYDGLDNDCNGLVDDCGFNTVSLILVGSGCMLLVVALILSKMGK